MSEARRYTITDIENYYKGQLSLVEMHALEKAALDDPFLAEAMEGYRSVPHAAAGLTDLKQRLSDRITAKPQRKTGLVHMPWFRAAAMIFFILGAGLLVYQFVFTKSDKKVAAVESNLNDTRKDTTTGNFTVVPGIKTEPAKPSDESTKTGTIESIGANKSISAKDTVQINSNYFMTQPTAASSDDLNAEVKKEELTLKDVKKSEPLAKKPDGKTKEADKKEFGDEFARYDNVNQVYNKKSGPSRQYGTFFRGRVTDPNNNPVPFANISTTRDNATTYTDANGNFTLNAADTVLDVQIKSVGYEVNNTRLRGLTDNKIVLAEDNSAVSEVVVNASRANTSKRKQSVFEKAKSNEPEPEDSWETYDTYLLNNLQVPEEVKSKNTTGQVELSFEVNKYGKPVNIKIEKSLCAKCDEEAIRLIKEGPKWRRNSKKARAVVTVPFSNLGQ